METVNKTKRTKIVATISDKNCDYEFIKQLYEEGINVVRINTAHVTTLSAKKVIENVRKVSNRLAVLIDTKGPEIRTTECDNTLNFNEGETVNFKGGENKSTKKCIYVTHKNFVNDMNVGAQILIDDGEIAFEVIEKNENTLVCRVKNDGEVKSRKSVNIPGSHISLPSLSSRDREFIKFAIDEDISFIAHSFVRNKHDVLEIQEILDQYKSEVKIIAKIENQQGVDNIDQILEHVYGIMIARGDLGIEIPAERIPAIQKKLNKKCIAKRIPVIVATQMLHSMIENPRPTRAEVNDVANAIYDGADAIMLSGETAYGEYPVESVKIMTKIAIEVENIKKDFKEFTLSDKEKTSVPLYLAKSAVKASSRLNAKAIIADTISGSTIRNLAAFRGKRPIYAMCYNDRMTRELALSYGVFVEFIQKRKSTDEFFHKSASMLINKREIEIDDLVIVIAGNFGPGIGASFVEISTADHLINRY